MNIAGRLSFDPSRDSIPTSDGGEFRFTPPEGVEILEQVREQAGGVPDAFVVGVGTGGTLTGVGRRLRETARRIAVAQTLQRPDYSSKFGNIVVEEAT